MLICFQLFSIYPLLCLLAPAILYLLVYPFLPLHFLSIPLYLELYLIIYKVLSIFSSGFFFLNFLYLAHSFTCKICLRIIYCAEFNFSSIWFSKKKFSLKLNVKLIFLFSRLWKTSCRELDENLPLWCYSNLFSRPFSIILFSATLAWTISFFSPFVFCLALPLPELPGCRFTKNLLFQSVFTEVGT